MSKQQFISKMKNEVLSENEAMCLVAQRVLIEEKYGIDSFKEEIKDLRTENESLVRQYQTGEISPEDLDKNTVVTLGKIERYKAGLKFGKKVAEEDKEIKEEAKKIVDAMIKA